MGAKATHIVVGLMPVILAEDETNMKTRITWKSHSDVLARFFGSKDGYVCLLDFNPTVGNDKMEHERIMDAFKNN